jgi:iron complex outermembrane receptor protein
MHKGFEMRVDEVRAVLARVTGSLALASLVLVAPQALAQGDESTAAETAELEAAARTADEVVVTGSRLKRDTFTSISPLQVISGQVSREIGLIDPSSILQESTAASGVQIDLTFQGFVLDNGPGATQIDLRGLGAERTLLLINGRRVAPAGVEGAPATPDTQLIPGSLVQQYEVLLDGASSVYGSDALAGVVNVILKKDFDGLELEAFSNIPAGDDSAGMQNRLAASWGYNGDRGFIGIGAEYRDQEVMTLDDRPWTRGCDTHYEIDDDGNFRTLGIDLEYEQNMRPSDCKASGLVGRMFEGFAGYGSIYWTPGSSNTGIPNFSENTQFGVPISEGADGYNTVSWVDYSLNGAAQFAHVIPDIQTYSAMAFGEYTFEGEANITPYFEVLYARRDVFIDNGAFSVFPDVPGLNPFNPCNPNQPNGVDCGLVYDALLDDPDFSARFAGVYGITPAEFRDFGIVDLYAGALGPIEVTPIVSVKGDRTDNAVVVDQLRFVGGVSGDMPFMNNVGPLDDWSFDLYFMHSTSEGDSSRYGIRQDRMDFANGFYSTTGTPCVNDVGADLDSSVTTGCVPVNWFAPSLYDNLVGDFATSAERDYLFDTRDFVTEVNQTVASFYMNGGLFEMPAGTALFGIGAEWREDEINSLPDDIAARGLFTAYFSDLGAVGKKWTKEGFAELELPLLADVPAFKELTINASSRWTEDEFYGDAWTYSGKMAWRPIDSLLLRGTVGTSFRAPNLRENFLLGTTGFNTLTDPCVIPDEARDELTGGYNPALDDRDPEILENCSRQGVDPTALDNNGINFYSVELSRGGATDIVEETSESFSAGFTFEQPWFTAFDLVLGATYYDIDIRDEIINPSGQFIVNDCYTDLQFDSPFCSRITRDSDGFLDFIDAGFINRDSRSARGVDVNMRFDWPTQVFGRAVDFQADFAFNRSLSTKDIFLDDDGNASIDELIGEFGYPEWKGRMFFRADVGDWRYTWSTRYLGSVEQDPEGIDVPGNVTDPDFPANTCLGPDLGDVNCRDVGFADNYFVHDMSVYYRGDVWTVGAGMRNVLNEEPPKVDGNEVFAFNNVPFGAGYDIFGRQLFLNVVWRWE